MARPPQPDGFNAPTAQWHAPRRGGYQPPATPDNASARLNGMHPSVNVGDDAHIVPPGLVNIRARLNGEMLIYPVPFNVQGGSVGLRAAGSRPYGFNAPR